MESRWILVLGKISPVSSMYFGDASLDFCRLVVDFRIRF